MKISILTSILFLIIDLEIIVAQEFSSRFTSSSSYSNNIFKNPEIDDEIEESLDLENVTSSVFRVQGSHTYKHLWGDPAPFNKRVNSWSRLSLNYSTNIYQQTEDLNTLYFKVQLENKFKINSKWFSKIEGSYSNKLAQDSIHSSSRRIVPFGFQQYHITSTNEFRIKRLNRIWVDLNFSNKTYQHRTSLDKSELGVSVRYRRTLNRKSKAYWRTSVRVKRRHYPNQPEFGVFNEDGIIDDVNNNAMRIFTYALAKSSVSFRLNKSIEINSFIEAENRWQKNNNRLQYNTIEGGLTIRIKMGDYSWSSQVGHMIRNFSNYEIHEDEHLRMTSWDFTSSITKKINNSLSLKIYGRWFKRHSNNDWNGSLFFEGYNTSQTGISLTWKY